MVSHQAVAHILVIADGDTFGPVFAQVFSTRVFSIDGRKSFFDLSLAVSASKGGRRTHALVEVDVRDASGAVATIMIGAYVTRRVTVTVRALEARLAQTSISVATDGQATCPIFAQVVITDVVPREYILAAPRVP